MTTNKLKARTVTIGEAIPHGDYLARAGAELLGWQDDIDRLAGEMAELEALGIFTDDTGAPVVPGWWDRKEGGHHKAWYLVWPAKHARRSGRPRRQYVKAGDLEATRATVARTLEYAGLRERRDRLADKLDEVGHALDRLAVIYRW